MNKFNIGDTVVSSKLGPAARGVITHLIEAKNYLPDHDFKKWDSLYDWRNGYVYAVKLETPIAPCRKNECDTYEEMELVDLLPKHQSLAYPEDDLILG